MDKSSEESVVSPVSTTEQSLETQVREHDSRVIEKSMPIALTVPFQGEGLIGHGRIPIVLMPDNTWHWYVEGQ